MAFVGQAITGLASPLIASVPAKVSQHWFCEKQRPVATAILGNFSNTNPIRILATYSTVLRILVTTGLSNPLGLVVGQALTPLLVTSASAVPLMNVVWFVPALLGAALTFLSVTSSRPPTPPSRSAALETHQEERHFGVTIKALLTNRAYIVVVFVVGILHLLYYFFEYLSWMKTQSCAGGAQGYLSAQQIKNEPIMCSLGYSNFFSGLTASLVFIGGIVGEYY